jgi:hypothetical protein
MSSETIAKTDNISITYRKLSNDISRYAIFNNENDFVSLDPQVFFYLYEIIKSYPHSMIEPTYRCFSQSGRSISEIVSGKVIKICFTNTYRNVYSNLTLCEKDISLLKEELDIEKFPLECKTSYTNVLSRKNSNDDCTVLSRPSGSLDVSDPY